MSSSGRLSTRLQQVPDKARDRCLGGHIRSPEMAVVVSLYRLLLSDEVDTYLNKHAQDRRMTALVRLVDNAIAQLSDGLKSYGQNKLPKR